MKFGINKIGNFDLTFNPINNTECTIVNFWFYNKLESQIWLVSNPLQTPLIYIYLKNPLATICQLYFLNMQTTKGDFHMFLILFSMLHN